MKKWTFSKFLFSYIAILLISMLIGAAIYHEAAYIVEKEINRSNMAMLQQTKQVIDQSLEEAEKIAQQIALNENVQRLAYVRAPLSVNDSYRFIQLLQDFSSYRNVTSFISDFYVFFRNSDVILTSINKYEPDFFYKTTYTYEDTPYEQWHDDILQRYYYGEYIGGNTIDVSSKTSLSNPHMLTYMKSVAPVGSTIPNVNIAVLIDERKVMELLNGMAANGAAYIIDKGNNVILSSDSTLDNRKGNYIPQYGELNGKSGLIPVQNDDTLLLYVSSSQNDWKYALVAPKHIFMQELNYFRDIMFRIVIIYISIGLLIAYFLAYRNYYPIKSFLKDIWASLGKTPQKIENNVDLINQAVVSMVKENEQLKSELGNYQPVMKANFLSKLVKGDINGYQAIEDSLMAFGIDFVSDRFAIALFHINNYNDLVQDDADKKETLVRFITDQVNEELANNAYKGYMTELDDDTLAFIINARGDLNNDDIEADIRTLAERARASIKENCAAVLTVCLGRVHSGIKGIKKSCKEALEAIKYKIVYDEGAVIAYSDVCYITYNGKYYYSLDIEKQLINCVRVGDEQGAIRLLDEIFEENFTKRKLPFKLLQCLFFDIMNTAVKTLDEVKTNVDDDSIFEDKMNLLERLLACETVDELYAAIKEIYSVLFSYIDKYKISHNDALKEQIANYLEKHYTDQNLNQTAMAEELGISRSYLSHFFKDQFGDTMVDYVTRLRIEKAKKLLISDKKLPVSKIAPMVGCSNDIALIRIFKKYEGITPNQYRKSVGDKNDLKLLNNGL